MCAHWSGQNSQHQKSEQAEEDSLHKECWAGWALPLAQDEASSVEAPAGKHKIDSHPLNQTRSKYMRTNKALCPACRHLSLTKPLLLAQDAEQEEHLVASELTGINDWCVQLRWCMSASHVRATIYMYMYICINAALSLNTHRAHELLPQMTCIICYLCEHVALALQLYYEHTCRTHPKLLFITSSSAEPSVFLTAYFTANPCRCWKTPCHWGKHTWHLTYTWKKHMTTAIIKVAERYPAYQVVWNPWILLECCFFETYKYENIFKVCIRAL